MLSDCKIYMKNLAVSQLHFDIFSVSNLKLTMINIQAMTISRMHQWYTYFILMHAVFLG